MRKDTHQEKRKSGNPTQPDNRSTASLPFRRSKGLKISLIRTGNFFKALNWKGRTVLAVTCALVILAILPVNLKDGSENYKPVQEAYAKTAEAEVEMRYALTDAERQTVASVVTAEADSEPYAGKVAVAQCILQACEDDGIRPKEVFSEYKYSSERPEPTDEALEAVQAVFDEGQIATAEPIKYFYAPDIVTSDFHESQEYVLTINNHRFFKEAE